MPNIAAVLKSEIARVARKELKSEIEQLRKSSARYRSDIAELKRRIATLESNVKAAAKGQGRSKRAVAAESGDSQEGGPALRFSAERFGAMRKKLGLSAKQLAALIGVSQLSVYKWEQGKARPRSAQLQAIAVVRGFGKREAQKRLEQLAQE